MTMLLQQNINHTDISYHMHEYTLADVEKGRRTGQIVLDLRIGARQDPGIRRRYRPNEDTILVARGLMPSASLSTPPKLFDLLVVADGMGRRQARSRSRPWPSMSLAPWAHSRGWQRTFSPCSERVSSLPIGSCMSATSNRKPRWAQP